MSYTESMLGLTDNTVYPLIIATESVSVIVKTFEFYLDNSKHFFAKKIMAINLVKLCVTRNKELLTVKVNQTYGEPFKISIIVGVNKIIPHTVNL